MKPGWARIDDAVVASTLRDLDRRLQRRFGPRYVKLMLFGSRARRDHGPDSDADVAVVLRGPIVNEWALTKDVLKETYDLLLETGLYIEPWLIAAEELLNPDVAVGDDLAKTILRDGVALEAI